MYREKLNPHFLKLLNNSQLSPSLCTNDFTDRLMYSIRIACKLLNLCVINSQLGYPFLEYSAKIFSAPFVVYSALFCNHPNLHFGYCTNLHHFEPMSTKLCIMVHCVSFNSLGTIGKYPICSSPDAIDVARTVWFFFLSITVVHATFNAIFRFVAHQTRTAPSSHTIFTYDL